MENLEHIGSVIPYGRGPGESLMCNYLGQYVYCGDEIIMYFTDLNNAELRTVNVSQSLVDKKIHVDRATKIRPDQYPIFITDNDDYIYSHFDSQKQELSYIRGDITGRQISDGVIVYRNLTAVKMEKTVSIDYYSSVNDKIASSPLFLNQIHILNLDGSLHKIIRHSKDILELESIMDKENHELNVYYPCTRITDEYIFSLYMNQPLTEWQHDDKPVEIHVFNWNGLPVCRLRFNEYLQYFAVDRLNAKIYGIDHEERIYRYDLAGTDIFKNSN